MIRDHHLIRNKLSERFTELGLNLSMVVERAAQKGKKMQLATLLRYMNNEKKGRSTLKQIDVLWLCREYKIKVELLVTKLPYEGTTVPSN